MYNYVLYTRVPCLVWLWCRIVGQSRLNAELLLRPIRENQTLIYDYVISSMSKDYNFIW